MNPATILYIHNSARIGGGNKLLLTLFAHLNRSRFRPVALLPSDGPMGDELRARAIPFRIAPLDRAFERTTRIDAMRAVRATVAALIGERPHIVHANGVKFYRYAGSAAEWLGASRVCNIHHPGEAEGTLGWAFKSPPDVIVTPSQAMLLEVAGHVRTANLRTPVVAVHAAVETNWFEPAADKAALRKNLGLDRFSHLLAIVGLVSARKGHRLFLDMAARVLEPYPRAGFLVVGEDVLGNGAYRHEMERHARELGIAQRVVFYGFAPDELARDLLAASDMLVLPTTEEGFGLALGEAQACGLPVVSTNTGPIPEVVEDGVTGVLVPPGDLNGFTAAAVSLLADPGKLHGMGSAGRKRALRLFSPQRYAQQVEALYDELMRGKRQRLVGDFRKAESGFGLAH